MGWRGLVHDFANLLDPTWIRTMIAMIPVAIALAIWRWRRGVFRGSGAAIIALLDEPSCRVRQSIGRSRAGRLSHCSSVADLAMGEDRWYPLCNRDLDRLQERGYISMSNGRLGLSGLGRRLLEKYENGRSLARGVARVRRRDRLRCAGGRWFRCRCQKYKYHVAGRDVPLPFFVGKHMSARMERRLLIGS